MNAIFILVSALALVLVCYVIWVCYVVLAKKKQEFNARFPPISDAEFVARCTPGINPKVALRVRRIVADNLGVDYFRIYPSTRFVDDLGAD